ncbi:MAG: hypothetical protein MUF49_21560 [Oculatellaceae cyanobacterium Prado106]|nr:hypothetical protein [Oculatellaceae cyanobacterium Prado106]
MSYLNFIIGAATFDHSGLPKEYYVTADSHDVSWVQTIFQGLGLQALLTVSLNLQGSQHIVIQSKEYRAIVIRQRVLYLALLIGPSEVPLSQEFVRWAEALDPRTLKNHERFSVA